MGINGVNAVQAIKANIIQQEQDDIKHYLLGTVNCWCKNCLQNGLQQWFGISELVGDYNSKVTWDDTPLIKLFNFYNLNTPQDAMSNAAKDAGILLKQVLFHYKLNFDTQKINAGTSTRRQYKLV